MKGVALSAFPLYSTYMFAKQEMQFAHVVSHDGFGCRSGVVSDVVQITWDFQEASLLLGCRKMGRRLNMFFSNQKENGLAILVACAESAHASMLASNTST